LAQPAQANVREADSTGQSHDASLIRPARVAISEGSRTDSRFAKASVFADGIYRRKAPAANL
jgi:hypothetical protein